jgi:hypothetical protein
MLICIQPHAKHVLTGPITHGPACVAWQPFQVIESVLSDEDGEAPRDIEAAYSRFLSMDVLDISPEVPAPPIMVDADLHVKFLSSYCVIKHCVGPCVRRVQGKQAWHAARETYEQRIDRLEDRVIRILCDRLR